MLPFDYASIDCAGCEAVVTCVEACCHKEVNRHSALPSYYQVLLPTTWVSSSILAKKID